MLDRLAAELGLEVVPAKNGRAALARPDGTTVRAWLENYPYPTRLPRKTYEPAMRSLQIELLKLQNWVKATGGRLVMLSSPCSRTAACLGERSRQP
jgi:polyphosphate kinase 2 (PPK2 family)